jgi:Uncharacterised conserved protein
LSNDTLYSSDIKKNFLFLNQRTTAAMATAKCSAERLRSLYTNLLQCIDVVDCDDDFSSGSSCSGGGFDNDGIASANGTWNVPISVAGRLLYPLWLSTRRSSKDEVSDTVYNDRGLRRQELLEAFRHIATHAANETNDSYFCESRGDGASAAVDGPCTSSSGSHNNSSSSSTRRRNALHVRAALKTARKLEANAVQIVREIGAVVVNAEAPSVEHGDQTQRATLRDDDTFAYFCEKAILVLLVEIVVSKMPEAKSRIEQQPTLGGVTWSPKVKAQVLHTVSVLIAGVKDASALYFLLSQNCMNLLILSMQEHTSQSTAINTTDHALEEMLLSTYADLLKTLALHLCGSPELFPLYTTLPTSSNTASVSSTATGSENQTKPTHLFPLFSATVRLATSTYAQSDSYIHAAGLNLIVGLMGISDDAVRYWMCHNCQPEHELLCDHLCRQFIERYRRIVNLTTGPAVDPVRHVSIGAQLTAKLDDLLNVIADLFSCNVKIFSLRLCERLLSQVVHVLWRDVVPPTHQRRFLHVGVSDQDVIPGPEAAAQAASLVLARMFCKLQHYPPFVRMLAVALFHPRMSPAWGSKPPTLPCPVGVDGGSEFVCMSLLNKLVVQVGNDDNDAVTNTFRDELIKTLSCEHYGEWRFLSAAAIVEHAMQVVDIETLGKLQIFPIVDENERTCSPSAIEQALASFLAREHTHQSNISIASLECAASLAIQLTWLSSLHVVGDSNAMNGVVRSRLDTYHRESPILRQLQSTKARFFGRALEAHRAFPVNDIVVDLVETVIKSRYKRRSAVQTACNRRSRSHVPPSAFAFRLPHQASRNYFLSAEPLVRKVRGVDLNEVETTRFYVQMAFHYRAVCRIVQRNLARVTAAREEETAQTEFAKALQLQGLDLEDEALKLQAIFTSLVEKPALGSDLNLHGRMVFGFTFHVPSTSDGSSAAAMNNEASQRRNRTLSDDMIFRESSELVLVLDPTDLFIVKPWARQDSKTRGTLVCSIPMLDVVAAAVDDCRLHVAVHHDNVGFLIQNGNMIFAFESAGTSLIVCRYLEQCRGKLRKELNRRILQLFADEASLGATRTNGQIVDTNNAQQQQQDGDLPRVNTF